MIHALKDICYISEDDSINLENYIDALNYIDNLYLVLSKIKTLTEVHSLKFLPSFKGKYVSEKLGIASYPEENEMRLIKLKSDKFIGDSELVKSIEETMEEYCNKMIMVDNIIILFLK